MFLKYIGMRIGIVGGGFVGSATALLECDAIEVRIFDKDPRRCLPPSTTIHDLVGLDFVFVCVPTPSYEDGRCNTTIVKNCIQELKSAGVTNIVLRSTVPPGTSKELDVMFMPEFLTEINWRNDFFQCAAWIFGARHEEEKTLFTSLIQAAYSCGKIKSNDIQFTSTTEAELVKYTRNNFLALKISFYNEIYQLCSTIGCDYNTVRDCVTRDTRIGNSHSLVPGYDGHFGFGGTCLPKDTASLATFMKQRGVESPIIDAMVYRNNVIDRPEKDWQKDPRAFTKS
ncbi:MAG: UDP-glucose/GDP-mannose dehydrogenase family protein [Actinobacteria bacterium]|nr:UDP-glucose/GDP-mannose dehydrogenase family protein [Actinomycetota bacterium]